MIKIIDYTKADNSYSRKSEDNDTKRILAENEIEQYLNEGWEIISSNMSATYSEIRTRWFLTVILYKKEKNV